MNNVLRAEKAKHIKRRSSAEQHTSNTIEHMWTCILCRKETVALGQIDI